MGVKRKKELKKGGSRAGRNYQGRNRDTLNGEGMEGRLERERKREER